MSKQVDTNLLNARSREREVTVSDGRFIEGILATGKTLEDVISDAKDVLGIKEDDLISINFSEKLAEQNIQTKAFVSLTNFTSKARETKLLTEEELSVISIIEDRLAREISKRYGIDLEDLYVEEE